VGLEEDSLASEVYAQTRGIVVVSVGWRKWNNSSRVIEFFVHVLLAVCVLLLICFF
jgi:hypothetical protein